MNNIIAQAEQILADTNTANTIRQSRLHCLCLAELVYDSLFFVGNNFTFPVEQYMVDEILYRLPALHTTGTGVCIAAHGDTTGVALLDIDDNNTVALANLIASDVEIAGYCVTLAHQIMAAGYWQPEDMAYDCAVQIGFAEIYPDFEQITERCF